MTFAGLHQGWARVPVLRRCLIAALPLSIAGAAHAKTDLTVDGSVSGRMTQNPYLDTSDQSSGSVVASVSPRLTFSDVDSQVTIGGSVQHTEFTRFYPSSDAVSARVDGNWRFSPKWTANASIGYDNSIVGETGFFNLGATDPNGVPLPPTTEDLTLAGRRIKRRSISVNTGLTYRPNGRETMNMALFASDSRALATIDSQNYVTYGNTIGYSRQISSRTSIGFTNSIVRYECRDQPGRCYTNSYQPQLTFSTTLGREWTLSGSAGGTLSQVRLPSETADRISPAGSATLCRQRQRMDICLTASQTIETTTSNGARPAFSLSSSMSYRIDRKSSVGLYAAYTKSAGSALNRDDYTYLSARITGSRSIGRNISFTVDTGYDRSESPVLGSRSSLSASMGLSFSLGRTL